VAPKGEWEAILLDWGDTLVYVPGYTTSPARHLECVDELWQSMEVSGQHLCLLGGEVDCERFRAAYEAVCAEQLALSSRTGREHRLEDRLQETLRRAGCTCAVEAVAIDRLVTRFADALFARTHPMDGAAEVLAALSDRYRLGLVANYPFPRLVLDTLERFGLRPYFTTLVISGSLGWAKPHPTPFREALRGLGTPPERALFVGDSLSNDMRGAKAAGLWTAWLAPERPAVPEPAVDYHLAGLKDLLAIVDGRGAPRSIGRSEA